MTPLLVDVPGTAVAISVPHELAADVDRLASDLPRAACASRELSLEASGGEYRLLDGGSVVLDGVAAEVAAATVMWRLSAIAIESHDHVVLHAGCVARDGRAVVLPAASGAGKSTLTAAAVAAGFSYLTDDHAAIDLASGAVVPFPRPIDLGDAGLVPARELRPGSVAAATAPGVVVFPRYAPGATPEFVELRPTDTVLALCAHTTNLARGGARAFVHLARLACRARAWRLSYRDTAGALAGVQAALDATTPSPVPARVVSVTPATTTVVIGEEAVVLDHATGAVHRLNESATVVWLRAGDDPDLDVVAEAVERDASGRRLHRADVAATLERLAALGLLTPSALP